MRGSLLAVPFFLLKAVYAADTPTDAPETEILDVKLDYILDDEPLPIVAKLKHLYQEEHHQPKPRRKHNGQTGPSHRNSQSFLQPNENAPPSQDVPNRPEPPHGEITMKTKDGNVHLLRFSFSPATCQPLSGEVHSLIDELSFNLLQDHPNGPIATAATDFVPSLDEVELVGFARGDREFRAALEFRLEGAIAKEGWLELVDMLGRTAVAAAESRSEIGMDFGIGMVDVQARVGQVFVKATWTFYEVVGRVPVECGFVSYHEEEADAVRDGLDVTVVRKVVVLEEEKHHDL
ncbi:hypothetical protein GLAREA_03559 [Glarea lozoyensis ATCC 20868]|uniref:Uncharacterized protein n=1 Tax=Glarea lozoyensis (strain ATCC 20868 / MF5171) TaxID=1116229 RepID=S3CW04_GLAL2|nr:uncharacterized protein GLAREA_03559 [Glarea lozoyensis ATCC 20868]EPE30592.1 hypothetical protein GLAREA_03559 [Glarea lozoyensis ATCC 20868]